MTAATPLRILGIDPGLRRTGFGVLECDARGGGLRYLASGTVVVPTDQPLHARLKVILDSVRTVAREHQPTLAALEKVFVNSNGQSTLLLGQARGAALCALADSGLVVHEYTASQIKKALTGSGRADKAQMQSMIRQLLRLNGDPAPDAADALACAVCHAHTAPLAYQLAQLSR